MYTLDLSVGDKHGRGEYPDWPTARDKLIAALTKFEPHVPTRDMCIARVMASDIETVGTLTLASATWRIVCQGELGVWVPRRETPTTVVES